MMAFVVLFLLIAGLWLYFLIIRRDKVGIHKFNAG